MHYQHDGVVTGDGAQDGGTFAVVNVIGHTAGVAGPCANNGNVTGELQGNKTAGHQHFAGALVVAAFVHASNRLAFFFIFLYNYSKNGAKVEIILERICIKERIFILFIL